MFHDTNKLFELRRAFDSAAADSDEKEQAGEALDNWQAAVIKSLGDRLRVSGRLGGKKKPDQLALISSINSQFIRQNGLLEGILDTMRVSVGYSALCFCFHLLSQADSMPVIGEPTPLGHSGRGRDGCGRGNDGRW